MTNYSTSQSAYVWTGLNTENQCWSYFDVTEDIILTDISIYWGGYNGQSTSGHYCVWKEGSGAIDLNGLIVKSGTISVGSGQAWHDANVTDTYLDAGGYCIGVWADPAHDRIFPQYAGNHSAYIYLATETSAESDTTSASSNDGSGVLPIKLNYYKQGQMWVNDSGTWKEGRCWVNDSGTWKKAKGVWVNNGGSWQRNQG